MRTIVVENDAQFVAGLALRFVVFVDEQGVDPNAEHDALDADARTVHVLVLRDGANAQRPAEGEVLGVGRVLAPGADGHPHVGRVAVRAEARRAGVGRELMGALEAIALERWGVDGAVTVALSAQVHAIPFYESLGYVVAGGTYLDEGIEHRDASKRVTAR